MDTKLTLLSAVTAAVCFAACTHTPQLGKDPIDDVIAAMTLEEKVHLVVGTGMKGYSGDSAVVGETRKLVPGAAGTTYPIPRLGIPSVVLADGPAGLRISPTREGDDSTYYCTHFPIATLLASTWDTDLVENVGQSIGNEVLEYGCDVLLAPALNIHRNPLCGRNFEYYSEDPLIAGKIAAAYVRGIQSQGVGTSIKHFAANNQESNRTGNDARVSERALREIYLRGFERAVKESNPLTVMSSYNYINGTFTSESHELLTDILRDEWGYRGMVMTDWFGGKDAPQQMRAGNDMLQPGTDNQYETILAAVKDGTLDEAILDRNVKRILEMVLQTPKFAGYKYTNKPDLKGHATVSRQSATEGMVLLKNDNNALPISKDVKNVALFGCTAYEMIAGGTGSGNVNRAYTVSMTEGLKKHGYNVDEGLANDYARHIEAEKNRILNGPDYDHSGFTSNPLPVEMVPSSQQMQSTVDNNDIAIVVLGRTSGEFVDRKATDFNISAEERQLIDNVSRSFHAKGKPVVVVLNIGGVIETASWKNMPDAILCAWQPGQEGGNSIADILTGEVNPSGKLPMTFPVDFADHASSANFPLDGLRGEFGAERQGDVEKPLWDYTNYDEDIYVGYRYFDSFDKAVSYPFGHGLSYTTFDYTNPSYTIDNGMCTIKATVKNTGTTAGREVVQVYSQAPNAKASNKPEHELRAFAKTKTLKPGQSETVSLTFPVEDLASFDTEASAWVVEPGTYTIQIASSSRDIRATGTLDVEGQSQKVNHRLAPQKPLNLLRR